MQSSREHMALLCCPSSEDSRDLCSVLHSLHVQVALAGDDQEVLELARENCFDLILVDLDKDLGWRSTVHKLRKHAPNARLLAYSRFDARHLWLDALDAGAFDFLRKPSRREELRLVLENALKSRRRPHPRPVTHKARRAVWKFRGAA